MSINKRTYSDALWNKHDESFKEFNTQESIRDIRDSLYPDVHEDFRGAFNDYFNSIEEILLNNPEEANDPEVSKTSVVETTKTWLKFASDSFKLKSGIIRETRKAANDRSYGGTWKPQEIIDLDQAA